MEKYDVCIIGGGPSGYAAAIRAVDFGKKVLLIEKKRVGGAGIHQGALSSKTFWELSREARSLHTKLDTYHISAPQVDFKEMIAEVNAAVGERRNILEQQISLLSDMGKLDYILGKGYISSEHTVLIETADGQKEVETDNIVIATGSRPRKLPHIPIDEKIIVTSDGIEGWEEFPESMVILGAGVIGCEYATIFSNFGKTKVHLIDKGDRILPFEDEDVVSIIEGNLEAKGSVVHRNASMLRMDIVDGRVEYELEYKDGSREIFNVDKALVSVGRVANLEELWDESIGIKLNERGYIDDNNTQTSVSNIYAVGDVTADIALVNVGELEGRYAIEKMFGQPSRTLMYDNISTIMFLDPEVAGVGYNEIQAKKQDICYKVVSLDYSCIPRAIAKRNSQGFIKILVTDDEEMKILGMRVVGVHASSAIQAVALLISMNKGIEELAELIHPHPSIIEGIQECVRMLLGKSILKPSVLKDYVVCRVCRNKEYNDIF